MDLFKEEAFFFPSWHGWDRRYMENLGDLYVLIMAGGRFEVDTSYYLISVNLCYFGLFY